MFRRRLTNSLSVASRATRHAICCTRKTTRACSPCKSTPSAVGGGFNHRSAFDDAMLIKDNPSPSQASSPRFSSAKAAAGHLVKDRNSRSILLDHLRRGAREKKGRVMPTRWLSTTGRGTMARRWKWSRQFSRSMASGASPLDPSPKSPKTGCDYASSGWITLSAPQLDDRARHEMCSHAVVPAVSGTPNSALKCWSQHKRFHRSSIACRRRGVNALNGRAMLVDDGRRPRLRANYGYDHTTAAVKSFFAAPRASSPRQPPMPRRPIRGASRPSPQARGPD